MAFRSRAGALLSMAVALLLAVTGCGTTLSALAGHSSSAPAASAGPFTLLQEPEAGLTPLRDIISAATKSVKFCIYELADPATEDALIASRNRGVQVQVLLDTAFHGQEANAAAYDKLSAAGVDVRWAPQDTILHEKSLTTDGTRSAIGTGNAQAKFMATSRDFWIIDTDPGDVAAAMWKSTEFIRFRLDTRSTCAPVTTQHPFRATSGLDPVWWTQGQAACAV